MINFDLCGEWEFREKGAVEWTTVAIPGSVLSGYLTKDKIEDPFYRLNEYEASELFEKDYEFKRTFSVSREELQETRKELVCEGLDTLTEIYVNQKLLAKTDNMHRTYIFNLQDFLVEGSNEILIRFLSVHKFRREVTPTPGKEIHCIPVGCKEGNEYLRKAHCMFGWDWGASIPDAGIFRKIGIRYYSDILIRDVVIKQKHGKDQVDLSFTILADHVDGLEKEMKVSLTSPDGVTLYTEGVMRPEEDTQLAITVKNPKLWWPNGMGEQPLYTVSVTAGGAKREYRIGLRSLSVSTDKDQWGSEFCFKVNGIKFFAMGANYIPEDVIFNRITRERIRELLQDCKRAHFNTVRVWGGGYYPSDDFYDLCDEMGFVVWQDFMFACNVYDATDEFAKNVAEEVKDNARRIRHHASLGLWCGNNEIESAWLTWESFAGHSEALKQDYLKLFEDVIPKALREVDTETFYWPSSPSSNGGFDNPCDEDSGDMHYWAVWHGLLPFEDYRKHYFRFCSEFGFQSFPCKKTVDTYTEKEDWNIFSEVMESHQKNDSANGKMLYYLAENFLYPKDFDSLLYVSQILQGIAIKAGVEHFRRYRGRCMGAIYWQLNDNWPVASWASVDYFGRWKALHYMAEHFFAPVAGSIHRTENKIVPVVQNESPDTHIVEVQVRLLNMQFEVLYDHTEKRTISSFSVLELPEIDFSDLVQNQKQNVFVEVAFTDDTRRCVSEVETFVPYKHLKLKNPEVSCYVKEEEHRFVYTLKAKAFAPFVELTLIEADGIFSDNYFHLTNGEEKEVYLMKEDMKGENPAVEIRTLHDSY